MKRSLSTSRIFPAALLAVFSALLAPASASAYTVLWNKPVAAGGIGYLYTRFYSVTEDDEFWAPTHNAGADLDGDGIVEFATNLKAGADTWETNIIDSLTGQVEYTYTWVTDVADLGPQAIVYFDADASDGFSEILIQSVYRCMVISGNTTIAVEEPPDGGADPVALAANRPNPFGETTRIPFELSQPGPVRLTVLDVTGRRIRSLLDGRLPAGSHTLGWDGLDDQGNRVPSGVYFARIEAGREVSRRKIVLSR